MSPALKEEGPAVVELPEANEAKEKIRKKLAARFFNPGQKPPGTRVIYSIADTPVSTPGNLLTILSQAKGGKTALISGIIASTFATEDADTLRVKSQNGKGHAVLHFDSEQAPDDHWNLIDRVIRRAQRQKPDWLLSWWLSGLSHMECQELIWQAMEDARKQFGGIHSLFIDGVADLVTNVNDPGECNPFVARLHGLAIEFDCPIVGVIHCNPVAEGGFQKSRGHLGSQLERKAESNLLLEKRDLITTVWSEKQRRAPILKEFGPRFAWSDEAGMHVSVETQAEDKFERYCHEVEDVFLDKPTMRYGELKDGARRVIKAKSETTVEHRITQWRKLGLIRQTFGKLWEKTT